MSAAATTITLLSILALNTFINRRSEDSADALEQAETVEGYFYAASQVYALAIAGAFLLALVFVYRKKKEQAVAVLFAIFSSVLTIVAVSTAFSSIDYLYLPAVFAVGTIGGHFLRWESVRGGFATALIITIVSVAVTRLWMSLY